MQNKTDLRSEFYYAAFFSMEEWIALWAILMLSGKWDSGCETEKVETNES